MPWDLFIQWLTNSWNDSGAQSLKDAIQILSATPWPNLTSHWFKALWNSIFGLSVIVAFFAIMFHSLIFMFRSRQGYSLVGSLAIFGRAMFSGMFGLLIVYAVIVTSSFAIQGLMLLGNIGTSTPNWMTQFGLATNGDLTNAWNKLGLAWLGMASGQLLSLQAGVLSASVYVFALYTLLTSGLGQSRFMQWIRSLFQAALWTAILSRVFQIGWLVVMSVVIHNEPPNDPNAAGQILLAVVVAGLLPVVLFIGLTARAVIVEGRLDARRKMRENADARASGATEAEIAERRARKVSGLKDAAIGAATAGAIIGSEKLISKAIAPIITKLSGLAHPAAPFIIMGAQAIATAATRKIHQKIRTTSDRVGSRRTT
ncbi:MAG: hypothetical protein JWO99_231 [Candidatus Saccharibacteria bacterium]|nr:hypothetical protein [Candidatus Saccharibacteria bacterium]